MNDKKQWIIVRVACYKDEGDVVDEGVCVVGRVHNVTGDTAFLLSSSGCAQAVCSSNNLEVGNVSSTNAVS